MCVRTCCYLVCTACNNQFMDHRYGKYFGSAEEAKEAAKARGWRVDEPVPNGSKWDFCPRCWDARVREKGGTTDEE